MNNLKNVSLILRLSLGFAFIYAAINKYIEPNDWIGFYPEFLRDIAREDWFNLLSTIGEAGLGLWLISGRFVYYAAILSALALAGIVAFNIEQMLIVFRDISLTGASVALALLHSKEGEWKIK